MKNLTNNKLTEDYIHYIKYQLERSDNTVDNYTIDLRIFEDYLTEKSIDLINVTKKDVEGFLLYMKVEKNWANSTRTRRLVSIRNFYQYLYDERIIATVPTDRVKMPPKQDRNPAYLTQAQAKRAVDATEDELEPYRSRDKAILMVLLTTGIRLSGLTEIKISDITEGTLSIIEKGNKQREVGLNNDTLKAIKDYLKVRNSESEYLFVSNRNDFISTRTVQETIKKYIKKAKLDTKKYSVHSFRHSAAVFMHKNGMDIRTIQKVLGHSQVQTTEIYTHVDNEQVHKAASALNGMFD